MTMGAEHATGGLVEMDERGVVVRSGSAVDSAIADKRIYPYSAVELRSLDRAVSTTTNMDYKDTVSTAEWVQIWRLSDLKLLKSIALAPGPRGDEQKFTGEPHLLPDGRSVYIHTFNCGMYLVKGLDSASPTTTFVKGISKEKTAACRSSRVIGGYSRCRKRTLSWRSTSPIRSILEKSRLFRLAPR